MDIALTDGYSIELRLNNIDPGEFLYLSAQVGNQLGWGLIEETKDRLIFTTGDFETSAPGEVIIKTEDTKAYITSHTPTEYLYDQQQDIANITGFQNAFRNYYYTLLQRQRVSYNPFPTQTTATPMIPLQPTVRKPHAQGNWGALIPTRYYLISPILIYLNILVFLLMTLSGISPFDPESYALIDWGGNFRPLFKEGEYWRLFTYMFLHAGIIHLAGNIFALLYIGLHLEPLLGKLRYASAYVLSGIAAGIVSMYMHGFSVGVGASGAIFGLYGVFFALLTTNFIKKPLRTTLLRGLLFFIVYNLLYGLSGNIDNAAHTGGLVSGMMIGYAYLYGLRNNHSQAKQLSVIVLLTIGIIAATIYSAQYFSR